MVTTKEVERQLKQIHFNHMGWGKAELKELPHILMEDETIYECANGLYEGGFALLVATNIRVLLIDKKPLNYLTVEDLRFDMISELDYSHRLFGASISISAGSKNLKFRSYNQPRLRKLMTHVQHCIAETKKKQDDHQVDQKQHLEQINQQLQTYLMAQFNQLQMQQAGQATQGEPALARPPAELSDYLFAQSLLKQYQSQTGTELPVQMPDLPPQIEAAMPAVTKTATPVPGQTPAEQVADLYNSARQEIFGKHAAAPQDDSGEGVSELGIAYSKLPMATRNVKFGRPSYHAHSDTVPTPGVS